MILVYECVVHEHDWRLLAVAVLLALAGSASTVALLRHARTIDLPRRHWWAVATAGTAACSVWSTHFVALLGFDPGVPLSYEPEPTLLSLGLAFALAVPAFVLVAGTEGRWGPILGGLLFGGGMLAMHYAAMAAVDTGAPAHRHMHIVATSLLLVLVLTTAAVVLAARTSTLAGWIAATGALAATMFGLYILGISALAIEAGTGGGTTQPPWWLAGEVTAISGLVISSALAALSLDRLRTAQEAARFREFADLAVEGLMIYDGEAVVAANRSFLTLYRSNEGNVVGRSVSDFFSDRDLERLAAKAPGVTIETELTDSSGEEIPVELAQRHTSYCGRPHAVLAVRDLRARRAAQQKIRFLAFNDPLTGLANRESFTRQLKRTIGRSRNSQQEVAVLALDLDNFKAINDTLGHPIGDKVLALMAERIQSTCRQDDVVGRLGGDEFAIFQRSETQPAGAESLARRIIELLSRPAIVDDQIVTVGASVGIALSGRDGETVSELMKNADLALYKAKDAGRGTYAFFEPEMDSAMRKRRALENDLRLALARAELKLAYHPLVQAQTNRLCGFEALLRWTHPDHGELQPNDFVPLAEQSGLIIPVGEWVLRKACEEASNWPEELCVAVNLSPVQFTSARLIKSVSDALSRAGLPATRLELEVTESVLLENSALVFEILRELRELGVKIVMDDFGTGYSSLSYLRSFPFDRVKIDRSFVNDIKQNEESAAIVRAIIGLGRSLGISTTAEGIETIEQHAQVEAEGCDYMQGFYFSKPMPKDDVRRLIEERLTDVA